MKHSVSESIAMCEQRGTEGERGGDHHALHVVPRLPSGVFSTLAPAAQQLPSLQVSLCHSNSPLSVSTGATRGLLGVASESLELRFQ